MCQICDQLKEDKNKKIELDYDCYTSLLIQYKRLWAYGEGGANTDIEYCPFCGKKFE